MSEFERSLKKVLTHEGGYIHHPKDPGGATNQGVTQRVYDDYRRQHGGPIRSVKDLTNSERDTIYRQRYWNLIKGDLLPAGISYVVFDGAVNSGVSQSVKWLQRALGIKADGVLGPATLTAIQQINDHDALIARIVERRMKFLKALKTWKTFGKGWTRRVDGVLATGQAWARGTVGPEIEYVAGGEAKARVEDAKAAPSTAPGDTLAGAGSIGAILTQAQQELAPYITIDFVAKISAALTLASVVIAIGGIAYRVWAASKRKELADATDAVPA
jgi:lysozyme family protein